MKRELNGFTHEELIAAFNANTAFWSECKQIADNFDTDFRLEEICGNVPNCVNFNIGYPGDYAYINPLRISYKSDEDVLRWLDDLHSNFDLAPGVDFGKAFRYLSVLSDPYILAKDKDIEYMEKYVDEQVKAGLSAFVEYAKDINEQFMDDYYLADCLLSCELLDEYYEEDGSIFKRGYDRKVA